MHYFEVHIDEEPAATYQAFGVANEYAPRSTFWLRRPLLTSWLVSCDRSGIDPSRSYLSGWTAKDRGIGWYNDGNVYVRYLLPQHSFTSANISPIYIYIYVRLNV